MADTDAAEVERVVRTHALGPHFLCRLVLPSMRSRGRGDIVMISSVATDKLAANGGGWAAEVIGSGSPPGTSSRCDSRLRRRAKLISASFVLSSLEIPAHVSSYASTKYHLI